jgi:hypothetical protein
MHGKFFVDYVFIWAIVPKLLFVYAVVYINDVRPQWHFYVRLLVLGIVLDGLRVNDVSMRDIADDVLETTVTLKTLVWGAIVGIIAVRVHREFRAYYALFPIIAEMAGRIYEPIRRLEPFLYRQDVHG